MLFFRNTQVFLFIGTQLHINNYGMLYRSVYCSKNDKRGTLSYMDRIYGHYGKPRGGGAHTLFWPGAESFSRRPCVYVTKLNSRRTELKITYTNIYILYYYFTYTITISLIIILHILSDILHNILISQIHNSCTLH